MMSIVYLQTIGCGLFVFCTIVLGIILRKYPSNKVRQITTMILHFIGVVCLLLPILIGMAYPCFAAYDDLLGIPSLPFNSVTQPLGAIMLLISISLFAVSNLALLKHGRGTAGFLLTQNVVEAYFYQQIRNPMSLGVYLGCLGFGMLTGSTYFTLWTLVEVIPSHIFFLKFFEEKELMLRFGQPYLEYKRKVPFLIPQFRHRI